MSRLANRIVGIEALKDVGRFIFYPLHFEPEVSLQVFGRPYQNQIELIRNIAANVPIGMKVLVKEHPRAKGFRPLGYYKKLLEIPNVCLVDMSIKTHAVIEHATMVAVISGSTGLEAAICHCPVLTFGTPVYNILSGSMIRHISNLNRLSWEINDLLKNYCHEESELVQFIAATIAGSVPVNLYTSLLGKRGRMTAASSGITRPETERMDDDYLHLKGYCERRIFEETHRNNQMLTVE